MTARGNWISGSERLGSSKTVVSVRNPWDDTLVAELHAASGADLEDAVSGAQRVQRDVLRGMPIHERAAALQRVSEGIRTRHDSLVDTVVAEAGKPIRDARREITRAAQLFKTTAEQLATMDSGSVLPLDSVPSGVGRFGYTARVPVGVIAAIVPSNSPVNLAANKVAPALAMGNAIIVKPADQTPVSSLMLAEIITEAGFPADAINIVIGTVGEVADPLVRDARIRMVTATGGLATGRAIAQSAGLKKLTLELGSSAANIVCADADVTAAARTLAKAAFLSSGQACISAQRLIVHESVEQEFVRELVRAAEAMTIGDPTDADTEIGPMVSQAHVDLLMEWIDGARAAGAKLLTGGERHRRTIRPTVLADVPASSSLHSEEAFGPIATLSRFSSIDEAIEQANDNQYGLQAGIFTANLQTAFRAAGDIDVGALWINDSSRYRQDNYPFGGRKFSGLGREGVRYAMEEMSELRFVGFRLDGADSGILG